jgi:gluconate 5-dehydrogenase
MSLSLFDLTGRTALITGSSQGIGFALARGLASAGARIVLNGRDVAKLSKAAAAIREAGGEAHEAVFDVTDPDAIHFAVARIEKEFGPIEILVNNAGITKRMAAIDFPPNDFRRIMETNVEAAFFVAQEVARYMLPRKRGKIINICSVQSELGRASITPYTVSKGAIKMMTKALCAEWGRHGLQVNGIGPGYFATELTSSLVQDEAFTSWLCSRTPAGRWGQVDELIGAAIFLASPASDFVNGHILMVDGGMTSVV